MVTNSYKLHCFDSARFMASSLSNVADNHSEGIHKVKCKYGYDNKTCKFCQIKYKSYEHWFKYTNIKDDLIEYNCLCCNKNHQKRFDGNLNKQVANTYKFLTMILLNVSCCCKNVVTDMNTWIIGKTSMKDHYQINITGAD